MLINTKAQSDSGPYSILFDEFHDQFYTYSNGRFTTALDYLNQTPDYETYLNKAEFDNVTTLLSYDMIIIGNPGPDKNFTALEIEVLKNYTNLGGNIFLLSNYQDVENPFPDGNITGNFNALNNITQALNISVLFNDFDLHSDPPTVSGMPRWIVEVSDSNFKSNHPATWKIKTVLTFTSGLNVTQQEFILATGSSASYLINKESDKITHSPWLVTIDKNPLKIIICGSTVMFSDTNVTESADKKYSGVFWIDAADNLRLWANLIQWALKIEIPNLYLLFIIIGSIIAIAIAGLFIYNKYVVVPQQSPLETAKLTLQDQREIILEEAKGRAEKGHYHAAAQLYKQAAKISNELKDYQAEDLYNRKHRQFLAKSK